MFSELLNRLGEDSSLHVTCHRLRWQALGVGMLIGCCISSAFWILMGFLAWVGWQMAT